MPLVAVKSLVIIDTSVSHYQQLIQGVLSDIDVLLLEPNQDGIEQITAALRDRSDLQTLHLVAHGTSGCLQLGNSQFSLQTIERYAWDLQAWFAFPSVLTPTLLLYGCNVAAGDAGSEFLAKLHQLTGAYIAASAHCIGNKALGGNWQLEVKIGKPQTTLAFSEDTLQSYAGVLA